MTWGEGTYLECYLSKLSIPLRFPDIPVVKLLQKQVQEQEAQLGEHEEEDEFGVGSVHVVGGLPLSLSSEEQKQ